MRECTKFSLAWDLRPMEKSGESWIQEGRTLNILIGSPPSLAHPDWSRPVRGGDVGALQACPVKPAFHFALEDPRLQSLTGEGLL